MVTSVKKELSREGCKYFLPFYLKHHLSFRKTFGGICIAPGREKGKPSPCENREPTAENKKTNKQRR